MKTTVSIHSLNEIEYLKQLNVSCVMAGLKGFQSGCDGVFTLDEVKTLKAVCDEHHLDVMILMNRLYFDEEMSDLNAAVKEVLNLGCRVLYCDPAVYFAAEELEKVNQLVYDSSTLMCNSNDVTLMQELGLDGVVLSREITLDEIVRIAKKSKGKCLVQVYGYQVMAHSKRHFLRNYLKEIGKELNLEDVRNLTLIETTRTGRMPILEEKEGCRIYTDYVLCALKELKAMEEAGVDEIVLDGIFIDRDEYIESVQTFQNVLEGKDAEEAFEKLKAINPAISTGYMYTPTNLLKTEGERQ